MEKVNLFREGSAENSKRIVVHVPGTEGRAPGYAGRCAPWAPGEGQGTRRRLPLRAGVACGARRCCRCRCSRSRSRCYRGALCAASRAPHGCASWSVLPYSTSTTIFAITHSRLDHWMLPAAHGLGRACRDATKRAWLSRPTSARLCEAAHRLGSWLLDAITPSSMIPAGSHRPWYM